MQFVYLHQRESAVKVGNFADAVWDIRKERRRKVIHCFLDNGNRRTRRQKCTKPNGKSRNDGDNPFVGLRPILELMRTAGEIYQRIIWVIARRRNEEKRPGIFVVQLNRTEGVHLNNAVCSGAVMVEAAGYRSRL